MNDDSIIRLFPRNTGNSADREFADRCKAHRLLDQLKAGFDISPDVVHWALAMTGDLGPSKISSRETR